MKKYFLAVLLVIFSFSAHSWSAIATDLDSEIYFSSFSQSSPEEAQQVALNRCNVMQVIHPGSCRNVGQPQIGKIIAVYLGDSSVGFGANIDGDKAAKQARMECEKISRVCNLIHVEFATHPKFSSVAFGSENGFYVHVNSPTQNEADEKVMSLCKSHPNEKDCKLNPIEKMATPGFYAAAYSPSARKYFIEKNFTEAGLVERDAINACQKSTGDVCQITIKPIYQEGGNHGTDEQKNWVKKHKVFAQKNFNKLNQQ